MLQTQHKTSIL